MKFVFGPVKSKRLGNSLGVDIVPFATCTYDCIYCQAGRTKFKTVTRKSFFELPQIKQELEEALKRNKDLRYITFSGSGEPTLNKDIGKIISMIKDLTSIPIALITNGSLLFHEDVRSELRDVDMIMPSVDAPTDELFRQINRPHRDLDFRRMIKGIQALRDGFSGKINIEIMLIKDVNDPEPYLKGFLNLLSKFEVDQLFLNTVVRPPLDGKRCKPLSLVEIQKIAKTFEPLGVPIELADPTIIQKRTLFPDRT